nr:integrase family protein [uncultured Noviherbaspirillum sp.]
MSAFECESGKIPSFLWDSVVPGLGLRASPGGRKSYIFQGKLKGQVIRMTIGDPAVWDITAAQKEAARLRVIINNGQDPRQLKADGLAAEKAEREARTAAENAAKAAAAVALVRDSITLADVWPVYIADRAHQWGERHAADHVKMIKLGGEPRKRSSQKVTKPAPLASLCAVRLVDLSAQRIEAWAKTEAITRPTSARLAWRMLKAFLNWCSDHPKYGEIITANPAQSKKTRESLGKPNTKNDVLQREQLSAWFAAVRKLGNPVTSAYLQCLLLSGARREEIGRMKWTDVDFQWKSLTIRDKVDGLRVVPLPPYMEHLILSLPRRNQWVFSSMTASDGRLADPTKPHNQACAVAGLDLSLHGLRRSFASLCEWTETPSGIAAQIQGHKPQGVREKNYIRRPLDLLRMWHIKIEAWILEQAGLDFLPLEPRLTYVTSAKV